MNIEIVDPRPDFLEDSALWTKLLKLVGRRYGAEGLELFGILHGMRCCGLRVRVGQSGGYVLRPEISYKDGFKDLYEYETLRDKYLKPHVKTITELMRLLKESEEGF